MRSDGCSLDPDPDSVLLRMAHSRDISGAQSKGVGRPSLEPPLLRDSPAPSPLPRSSTAADDANTKGDEAHLLPSCPSPSPASRSA